MQEIFVGSVISYNKNNGNYYVRLRGSSLDTERGVPARLLNPIPFEDGGGIKAAPEVPRDAQCLVLRDDYRCYILGFLQPIGLVAGGDATKPTRTIEEGEVFLTHKTRSKLGITKLGTILLQAQRWAQLAINPITQQLTAFFKNIRLNLWSAIVEYFYDSENEKGTFKISLTKHLKTSIPNPSGHPTMINPDRFILQAGALDDEHIIELEIEQGFPGPNEDMSKYKSNTKLGTQNGKYFEYSSRSGQIGSETNFLLEATVDSKLHTKLSKPSAQKDIDVVYDVNGEDAVTLLVNSDKAIVTIKHTGDVTIKTTDGAFIKLGGQGKEQKLVTKAWVDQIFATHIHGNGNQGAPTAVPIGTTPPSVADSSTGPFTYTMEAE